ncbi:DEAD/DEAH box helicase [Thiospirochaeta perfilievii]|uniref:DEAD-box ATP-dependent RNA helicase RhpA n=1 Tax=Thiospirochaeta perfilievii TaxID=252967 RepID=A0A5C1QF11_9SPIO|nr:DEAD/DEAH box helicase [Thiospirochaeta perfilievii]QEN06151.1 DEAD/DEAH box helicase [Thiospirochaeta perfilievii]
MKFDKLGLNSQILRAVESKGYKEATPIQVGAIPAILEGRDLLGGAQTGTGKTAAFALPILNNLSDKERVSKHPRALILTPTRELAAQVGESFRHYGNNLKLNILTIFGGVKINPQISALKNGVDILVATPGRLLDHLSQGTLNLGSIEIFVLDEADRMLDMGFIRDIKKIMTKLPNVRQNLLFSATYGTEIRALAHELLKNPKSVEVTKRNSAAEKVDQIVHHIDKTQKQHLLKHLIETENWYQVLVFVRTKHGANRLAKSLDKNGIPSAAIHGDKSQGARTRALKDFKKGDLQALIATDVAARGIHLEDLSHVVNYDLPQVAEDYVHRIGRTGRAGKSGKAISLVSPDEKQQLKKIEKMLKNSINVVGVTGFKPKADENKPSKKKVPDPFQYNPKAGNKKGKSFYKKRS